jgi:hypothetical protein
MDSTDQNLDIELLAALIDGRLSGAERERALKLLATSDEALELFAHSLQEQRASDVKVVPIQPAPRWRQWQVVVPVLAAAGLGFVMLPRITGSSARTVQATEYATQLAGDPRFATALREGWDQHGWSVTRGAGDIRSSPEPRFAFRLGVRSVDLQVALRNGDTALAANLVEDISQTLDGIKFTDLVTAKYAEVKSHLSGDPVARSIERAANAEQAMGEFLKSPAFVFGQWSAAADLAAQAREVSFFQSKHGTEFIRTTVPTGSLDADDTRDLQAIDARLAQASDDRAFDDIHAILQRVIRRRSN